MTDTSATTNPSAKRKKFENIIKQRDVINQTVFDSVTMEELGRVEVLWMYPQINRVLGFVCKSGFLGSKKAAFKLPQLESIGANGILVNGEGEPTVAAKVKQLESLIHSEVWSESGDRMGYIVDCLFNYRSGVIVRYLMVPSRLGGITDGVYFLSPKSIKSFGRQRVLIYADAAEHLKPYRKGWKYKLTEVRDTVRDDYVNEIRGELRSFAQQIQGFSKDAMSRVEGWGDRLRTETQTFFEQAKEQGHAFYAKARTSGQAIFDHIRTEGLSFNDHMQDTASRSDEDFSQNITFPDEEDAHAASVAQDYDRDTWDEGWNDWEEEQDNETPRPDRLHHPPEGTLENGLGDRPPLSNHSDKNVVPDTEDEINTSETVRSETVRSETVRSETDIWDDDWVDDEEMNDTHDVLQDTFSQPSSPSASPEELSNSQQEIDDDPWI